MTDPKQAELLALHLAEVSVVPRGANQHAHIRLIKRADDDPPAESKLGPQFKALYGEFATLRDADHITPHDIAELRKRVEDLLDGIAKEHAQDISTLSESTAAGGTGQPATNGGHMTDTADVAKLQEQIAKLTADQEKLAAERDEQATLAKMSDAEKEFMAGMSDADKAKFMAMKPEDRKARMKKSADDDEVIKVAGQDVRKSAVGEGMFAILKAQAEENAKLAESVHKAEEAAAVEAITKRLEAAGPVADVAKAAQAIRKLQAVDPDGAEALEATVKAAAEQSKKADAVLTKAVGSGKPVTGGAYDQMVAKATELRKADPKLTEAQAFAKVYEDPANADLRKQYQTERQAAN